MQLNVSFPPVDCKLGENKNYDYFFFIIVSSEDGFTHTHTHTHTHTYMDCISFVFHYLPEFAQIDIYWVGDAI